jgi:hypothetical protein
MKREEIESQLPRFVSTIEQELKSSRDVLSILESYKKNAGETLANELNITCAICVREGTKRPSCGLKHGATRRSCLTRCGGLLPLSVDNGVLYFQMLAHDFKQMELRKLKSQAQKIPPKFVCFRLFCYMFLMTYLVIIALQIIENIGIMF